VPPRRRPQEARQRLVDAEQARIDAQPVRPLGLSPLAVTSAARVVVVSTYDPISRGYGSNAALRYDPEAVRPTGRPPPIPGNRPHRFHIHRRIDSHATASSASSTPIVHYQLGT
jgi:hypothetical protein